MNPIDEMIGICNQYLSHPDRKIRDMAIILNGLLFEKRNNSYCGNCGEPLIFSKCVNTSCSRDKD